MSKYLVKGNEIFNGVIPNYENARTYSTSEIKVGTWIDGKPIYRKVFSFTTPTGNTDYVINTGISMNKIIV